MSRIPLRTLTEFVRAAPNASPLVSTGALAPNIGRTLQNPSGAQVATYLVGADSVVVAVASATINATSYGGLIQKLVPFPNIPIAQSSVKGLGAITGSQVQSFNCPNGAVPTFIVTANLNGISGTNSGNLLSTGLSCSSAVGDSSNGNVYSTPRLTPGVVYSRFGANISHQFYNPSGSPITVSYNVVVSGWLILSYPTA